MGTEQQISLKQLRAFAAVYRFRRLAAAAEHLSVTQSAVSVLLRQLESSLGVRLFDRTTRFLEPTRAADEAIALAERVLGDVRTFGDGMQALRLRQRGRVEVAVTPAVGMAVMPGAVRRFRAEYPDIQIVLDDCAPEQFLARVLSGKVEFGIGTPEQADPGIALDTLVEDTLCVVCASDHPLAARRRVRWTALDGMDVIAIRGGYGVRRQVDAMAAQLGVSWRVVNEAAFLTSALWMTASGLGVSILPGALVATAPYPNLVIRPLVSPTVTRAISVVSQRGRSLSPAAQGFVTVLRDDLLGRGVAHPTGDG
ncbi:LysR family transcriptional regulator [Achromobacter sp. GG226]|uniref:LysR family transcriptional regulator n=1 Tax=Verticiella alkaliphila TaxID=2779529 RepID=UPI001C0AC153|nr:LysR family transcriptional regulator [Verticiella sp. GG226]MBU4609643.1 LysR family transcriptional regulator [Verticiella sp. GG226]